MGDNYCVIASYGHVRELSRRKDVATQSNFKLNYNFIKKNICRIERIKKEAEKSRDIFLALDPDREGEAISWHIQEILKGSQDIKGRSEGKEIKRVLFREITENSIKNAIRNPRRICMDLVNAQQARCVLDLLVGFSLSPLLWKKIKVGLSAVA